MARLWRAYHPQLPSVAGSSLTLEGEEARHVGRVLRLKAGEPLAVFDGRGQEWAVRIVDSRPDAIEVELEHPIAAAVETSLEVVLFQGLCRAERMEWVIQKATELGVSAVFALQCERAEQLSGSRRLDRWRRIAIEACKQSGRRRLPRVERCTSLPAVSVEETLGLLLDPSGLAPPLGSVDVGSRRRVWLAVGPEGGFARREIERWSHEGWHRAGLGPRILRADTAGLVAAAIVLHRWADLGAQC